METKLAEILLVEDNEGDIELTKLAFKNAKFRNNLSVAEDGDKALDILFKRNGYEDFISPDIILLDLNLPLTDGREVLERIKADDKLKRIPVIVLTSSKADNDIIESYDLHANSYVIKPDNFDDFKEIVTNKFIEVVQHAENFWVDIVYLPPKKR
jgi:CheY-like chemotaxis protein